MKRRVKVTFSKGLQKAKKGLEARTSGLEIRMAPGLGYNANQLNWPVMAGEFSQPDVEVNNTLKAVPRDQANLEAEVGETAVTDLNGDGIPEHYKIGGKRHYDGGTPLYLPDNSFIFSRDRSMKIKDPEVLKQFGMSPRKGGYTPADIAKKYDINKFRKILADSNTDDLQRKTAETMIANYNLKLGKLALIQESMKGFPQGIPAIAIPYMESAGIKPEDLIKGQAQQPSEQQIGEEETEQQPDNEEVEDMAPQGKYGLNMVSSNFPIKQFGGTSDLSKFISGGSRKTRRVRVTMPKFQAGGSKKSKLPAGAVIYSTLDEMYADPNIETNIQEGKAFLKQGAGSYKRVDELPAKLDYSSDEYSVLNGKTKDLRRSYATIENELLINQDARDAIYNNYLKQIDDSNLSASDKDALKKKSKDEVINDLLEFEKHNYAAAANGINTKSPEWKNKANPQKAYEDNISALGLTPLNNLQIKAAQAAYIGMYNAANDDATKDYFTNLKLENSQVGEADEPETISSGKRISPIDGIYGDTSIGQVITPAADAKTSGDYGDVADTGDTEVSSKHLQVPPQTPAKRPWIQDIIDDTGAFLNLAGIKKRMPWQAVPETYVPEPTFYDPTRELAANMEAANVLTQGLGAFSGPQALSARSSEIQGQAAKAAADVLGRYENLNVGVANQFEMQKTGILNEAAQRNAQLATNLYDKVTIANQEFDKSKGAYRDILRKYLVNTITNAANTFNLNTLNPQYAVDPMRGGDIYFRNPEEITPDASEDKTTGDIYQNLYNTYPTMRQHPEVLWKTAEQMAGGKSSSSSDKMNDFLSKLQSYQGE